LCISRSATHSAVRLDRRDVPVALASGPCIRALDCVEPRWNDNGRSRAVSADRLIGWVAIISAVGHELTDRIVDLIERLFNL
jgi:hypothetical protein